MTQIIERNLHGLLVSQREIDGYFNASHLSKAHWQLTGIRREPSEWLSNKRTKDTLGHLSRSTGIPVDLLAEVITDGVNDSRGTYLHPKLAVRFGIWLSDEFGFAVECWFEDWLMKKQATESRSRLMPHEEALQVAQSVKGIHDTLADIDPRLAQVCIDRAMQTIPSYQPLLPTDSSILSGAVEIATNLGYKVGKEESQLGRAVAKAYRDAGLGEPQSVKRECGGAFRSMKVYPASEPVVIAVIHDFYKRRSLQ